MSHTSDVLVSVLNFFCMGEFSILSSPFPTIYIGLEMKVRFIPWALTPYYSISLIQLFWTHLPGPLSPGS